MYIEQENWLRQHVFGNSNRSINILDKCLFLSIVGMWYEKYISQKTQGITVQHVECSSIFQCLNTHKHRKLSYCNCTNIIWVWCISRFGNLLQGSFRNNKHSPCTPGLTKFLTLISRLERYWGLVEVWLRW